MCVWSLEDGGQTDRIILEIFFTTFGFLSDCIRAEELNLAFNFSSSLPSHWRLDRSVSDLCRQWWVGLTSRADESGWPVGLTGGADGSDWWVRLTGRTDGWGLRVCSSLSNLSPQCYTFVWVTWCAAVVNTFVLCDLHVVTALHICCLCVVVRRLTTEGSPVCWHLFSV